VLKEKQKSIFNYDFDWESITKESTKDICCEKYKKKGEKKCKNCPKRMK